MRILKRIALILLIAFALLQFIPRYRNKNDNPSTRDITHTVLVPEGVRQVFQKACYDCHSNNTGYPWYSAIQPFRLMMDRHVKKGKQELNFSEFGSYSEKRRYNKLNSIKEAIEDGSMPLRSYRTMHRGARLTKEEKDLVIAWANDTRNRLKQRMDKQ